MFIMSFMIKASMTPLVPPPSKDRISNPPSLIFSLSVTMPRKKIKQKVGENPQYSKGSSRNFPLIYVVMIGRLVKQAVCQN